MSTISAGTTSTTALVSTGDTTGNLILATGATPTTALTLNSTTQGATFAGPVNFASWTTATRPASPAVGQMGYNTTTGNFDQYTAGGWVTTINSSTGKVLTSQMPTGSVIQVVSTARQSESATTSTSFTDTGLSVSITPTSASSKIFVIYTGSAGNDGSQESYLTLVRGSTNLGNGSTGCARVWFSGSSGYHFAGMSMSYLDSPATTSATTYKVQFKTASGYVYISGGNSQDTITVMEIAA